MDKVAITSAIHSAIGQLSKSIAIEDSNGVDRAEFNTCFTYILDQNGMETARQGLKNLEIAAPYVLAFVPEINQISINSEQIVYKRGEVYDTDHEHTISFTELNVSARYKDANEHLTANRDAFSTIINSEPEKAAELIAEIMRQALDEEKVAYLATSTTNQIDAFIAEI